MPSARRDEIGGAERELAAMQGELYSFLQQKARLAALGTAVAKDPARSAQHSGECTTRVRPAERRSTIPSCNAWRRDWSHRSTCAVSLATNTLRYGRADDHARNAAA